MPTCGSGTVRQTATAGAGMEGKSSPLCRLGWGTGHLLLDAQHTQQQDPCHQANTAGDHQVGVIIPWPSTHRIPSRPRAAPSSAAPFHPAHPAGHPAGILIFPKISRGAGASAHRQQVTNKIFPLSRAPGMGLSLKMQSSAVPASATLSHLCQPLSAEHPAI